MWRNKSRFQIFLSVCHCLFFAVDKVLMPVYMPTCDIQGNYEWSQCSGEICWCVNASGTVRPETVTRGQIQCNASDVIVGQMHPVCQNGKRPVVCRDACRNATCPSHSDAFCAADPCNDCKVSFVDTTGRSVDCAGKVENISQFHFFALPEYKCLTCRTFCTFWTASFAAFLWPVPLRYSFSDCHLLEETVEKVAEYLFGWYQEIFYVPYFGAAVTAMITKIVSTF